MPPSLSLPDGREIALDASITGRVHAGVVVLDPVSVREEPAVWDEIEALATELRTRYQGRLPSEIPGLKVARDLYKSFAMEPSRHRPSSEALLRRVLKDKPLYRLNNAVDCCNLASLAFLLPIGMYDLDLIRGDVVLRAGREGEEYGGIRKGPVHLGGRLALFDDAGGFGSPTSDSDRTCVTGETRRILAVIMATAAYPADAMQAHLAHFADLFIRHCAARAAMTGRLGD